MIGIIGNGFIGKATRQLACAAISVRCVDTQPELCFPFGTTLTDLLPCSFIFICVPTPMAVDGSCNVMYVEEYVTSLRNMNYEGYIVIRSTIPMGTADRLGCYTMPEFSTERNYMSDFIQNREWIIGLLDNDSGSGFQEHITTLFRTAYIARKIEHQDITFVRNREAEMIKLFRNCFLATKVSFCNEMEEYCRKEEIQYNVVRSLATIDQRIGTSHTFVPGSDGKRGYGGTCLPKDVSSMISMMNQSGMVPHVLQAVVKRNEEIDRLLR